MNRKSYWSVTALIISTLIFSTLTFLTGCGSSSSTTTPPPPTVLITATSGGNQSAGVGATFTSPLVATVTTGGTPTSGVTVTFTAPTTPSGASGTFATSTPGATDTETTNSSGVATSQAFTANTTAGTYAVTASATGASTPASFSLTNTAGAAANLTATGGTPQNVVVSTAAASLVAQVTDSDGNGVQGVSVTFTASTTAGATGTFTSTTTNAETDVTDANGNATASDFVANSTVGGPYDVTASATGLTSVNFVLTNIVAVVPQLAAGNYVYYVSGEDSNPSGPNSPYYVAGVFTVNASGAITGGEQTFLDLFLYGTDTLVGATSSIVPGNNGNVLITLDTGDISIGVAGVETLNLSMVSASNGLLTEYDTWASGSGTLDLQTSTAVPAGGYAFFTSGLDVNEVPITIGGVINVDSAGGISGAGSVFDQNDGGTLSADQPFAASTVTGPDALGQVGFNLNPQNSGSTLAAFIMVGYIIDADHIRWVEDGLDDVLQGTTGGTALGQGTNVGNYGAGNLSGSSGVFGAAGFDANGPLQTAGLLNFNADGSVSGNMSFNDFVDLSPQGGYTLAAETTACSPGPATTGCYVVDSTGRVTITNVTDGANFNFNFQLYLAKDGGTVISMDPGDAVAGFGYGQSGAGAFTASSFNGNYVLNVDQQDTNSTLEFEYDGIGAVLANGTSAFTGFLDLTGTPGKPGAPLTPTPGTAGGVTGTFPTANANGVFTGTITGIDTINAATPDNFTFYLIGGTSGSTPASVGVIGIENDTTEQLTLATFELQQ